MHYRVRYFDAGIEAADEQPPGLPLHDAEACSSVWLWS